MPPMTGASCPSRHLRIPLPPDRSPTPSDASEPPHSRHRSSSAKPAFKLSTRLAAGSHLRIAIEMSSRLTSNGERNGRRFDPQRTLTSFLDNTNGHEDEEEHRDLGSLAICRTNVALHQRVSQSQAHGKHHDGHDGAELPPEPDSQASNECRH